MAREHARIKLSIWDDDDFRNLSAAAQHLYFALTVHPSLSYCGVADWRPARLAGFCATWTPEVIEIAAQELSEANYILIDTNTEEVLLRSFVRNDELMESPNMATAMAKAWRSVASTPLRGIFVHELRRLHDDKPHLKGWEKVSDLLDRASLNPSDYPSFRASVNPSERGSVSPSVRAEPNPPSNPSVHPSPTTAPNSQLLTPDSNLQPKSEDQDLGGERTETLPPALARCAAHKDNPNPPSCRGCMAAREAAERAEARAATEALAARTSCPDCHGTGWRERDDGTPAAKCYHPRAKRSA